MIVDRNEALKLAPDYVAFVEGDFNLFGKIEAKFEQLKKGQLCLTYRDKEFIKCKIIVSFSQRSKSYGWPIGSCF